MPQHLPIRRRDISQTAHDPAAPTVRSPPPVPEPMPSPATPGGAPTGFDFGCISIMPPESEVGPEGGSLSPALSNRIADNRGSGAPLEPPVRRSMESAFGHNFADVRVHADGESDTLNRSVSARAFTLRSDIFLSREATGAGPYGGNQLLAHELTHVVQQRSIDQSGPLSVGPAGDEREQEADSVSAAVSETMRGPSSAAAQQSPEGGQAGQDNRANASASAGLIRRTPYASAVIGRSIIQRAPPTAPPPVVAPPGPATATATPPGATPAASTGYKGPIAIDAWQSVVTPGPIPSGVGRDHTKSYIGDQHVITAKVSGDLAVTTSGPDIDFELPAEAGLHHMMLATSTNPSELKTEFAWQAPDTARWTITPTTPGHQHVTVSLADAEWENPVDFELDIAAGADPTMV